MVLSHGDSTLNILLDIITIYKNVRVTLTSQWGWRHAHINDTERVRNVIYNVRVKWRDNVFVVSQWVASQRVTSQWPRPRTGYSAFISIYSGCHGLQVTGESLVWCWWMMTNALPVKCNHRPVAPMTESVWNRLLRLLNSALHISETANHTAMRPLRLLPAFGSC